MKEAFDEDLTPEQKRRTLRVFLVEGALRGAYMAVSQPGNAVLSVFAMSLLGMSEENAGLVGAFAFTAAFVQILSFVITDRVPHKKAFVIGGGLLEMALLASVLLIPLFRPLEGPFVVGQVLFLAILFLQGCCAHLVSPLMSGWISSAIVEGRRGRYLGMRSTLMTGFQTLCGPLALYVVHRSPTLRGYAAILLFCTVAGALGYLSLTAAPMPHVSRHSSFSFRGMIASRRHRPFRKYMIFQLLHSIPFAFACAYYIPFLHRVVGLNEGQIALYLAAYSVVRFSGMWPAGQLVDRIGTRPVITAMVLIYAAFFASFPFFTLERLWLIVGVWGMVGLADSFYMVAVTSTLFHSVPQTRERTGYLAMAQGVVLLLQGIGPFFVRGYLWLARGLEVDVFGLRLERFRLLYALCAAIMLGSLFTARRLADTHDVRLGQLVSLVYRMKAFRLIPRFWKARNGGE